MLQFILLGLLKLDGGQSGYDLKQTIDVSIRHFWYSDYSQVYRALDALEKAGWVVSIEDVSNPHKRKIYNITEQGETAFQEWLHQDFEMQPIRQPILAKLFFGRFASKQRLKEQIREYRQHFVETQQIYAVVPAIIQSSAEENPHDIPFWLMTLDLGARAMQVYIDWCDAVLKQLEEQET